LTSRGSATSRAAAASGGSAWGSILTYLLPFVLFGAFWIYLMRGVKERAETAEERLGGRARALRPV
jgi:hypothetical protein